MSRRSERERNEARRNAVINANATWTALRAQPQPPLVVPQAPVRDVNPLSKLRTDYDKDYGTGEFDRITQATVPTSVVGAAISRLDQQQQQLQQQQLLDQQQQQQQQLQQQQQNFQDLQGRLPHAFAITGQQQYANDLIQQQLLQQQQQLLQQQQQQLLQQQQQQQQQDAKKWMEARKYFGTKGGGRRKSKKNKKMKNKIKSFRRSKSFRKNKY